MSEGIIVISICLLGIVLIGIGSELSSISNALRGIESELSSINRNSIWARGKVNDNEL